MNGNQNYKLFCKLDFYRKIYKNERKDNYVSNDKHGWKLPCDQPLFVFATYLRYDLNKWGRYCTDLKWY